MRLCQVQKFANISYNSLMMHTATQKTREKYSTESGNEVECSNESSKHPDIGGCVEDKALHHGNSTCQLKDPKGRDDDDEHATENQEFNTAGEVVNTIESLEALPQSSYSDFGLLSTSTAAVVR